MATAPEALMNEGHLARQERRLDDAARAFTAATELYRVGDNPGGLVQALKGLGQAHRDLRDHDSALRHYREAAAIQRASLDLQPAPQQDQLALAHTVRHVADILRESGKPALAAPCYEEALSIYRAHPQTPPLDLANTLRGYALLKSDTGQLEEARNLWQQAHDLYAKVHVAAGVAESEEQLAHLSTR